MLSLIDHNIYWDDLNLVEMKNVEKTINNQSQDIYRITKQDDSQVDILVSDLSVYDCGLLDSVVGSFAEQIINHEVLLARVKDQLCFSLDRKCDEFMTEGFYSSAHANTSVLYGLTYNEMTLINSQTLSSLKRRLFPLEYLLLDELPILWKGKNDVIGEEWTRQEWDKFYYDCEVFIKTCVITTQQYKVLIMAAEDIETATAYFDAFTLSNFVS